MGPIVDALMIKYRPTAVVSRSVARDLGLKHFFTGSGCRRGHEAVRFVSDGSCAVCASVRGRASDAANPERRRARERARYELDPTKFCERASAYRASDPVRQKELRQKRKEDDPEYFRRWYAENAEDQRAKARARRAAKPDVYVAHGAHRRARKAAAPGHYSAADIQRIRNQQGDKCGYCASRLSGRGQVDHIMPLARGGSNWPSNLQLLCAPCNQSKKDRDPLEFARLRGGLL